MQALKNDRMRDRREFLLQASVAGAMLPLTGCTDGNGPGYDAAVALQRAALPMSARFRDFVRFATLAPNGHNTQPWRFVEHRTGASILPDLARRTPIVDPDDHHLFVSLGCAAETFVIASGAHGLPGSIAFAADRQDRVEIDLAAGTPKAGPLYRAIPLRQSTRSVFDGRAISLEHLAMLEAAARIEGVTLLLITDAARQEDVLEFVLRGNGAQMDDPAFVNELRGWVRFNPAQAMATGDGLSSVCSGSPAIPAWVGKRFFGMVFTRDAEDKKYIAQMRSSAGLAVFVGDRADKDHWVRVGRSFQRFALQATALGIRLAMVNQPVEVPAVRSEFARWLGIGTHRPDLVVRFGHAPHMPMSLRRPLSSVIVSA